MTVKQHDAGSACYVADMRKSRRVNARLEAVLLTEHGKVAGQIVNLSRSGLCIESNKALADLLLAGTRGATGAAPASVQVHLALPVGKAGTVPVCLLARAVYVIHDHADVYRCGLEFSSCVEGEGVFEAYLLEIGLGN